MARSRPHFSTPSRSGWRPSRKVRGSGARPESSLRAIAPFQQQVDHPPNRLTLAELGGQCCPPVIRIASPL